MSVPDAGGTVHAMWGQYAAHHGRSVPYIQEATIGVAIAAVGFAALAYVFCCQNAGAVVTSGTAIKEAAAVGSFATQTRYYWRGYRKCYRQLVIGPMSAGAIGFRTWRPRPDRTRLTAHVYSNAA